MRLALAIALLAGCGSGPTYWIRGASVWDEVGVERNDVVTEMLLAEEALGEPINFERTTIILQREPLYLDGERAAGLCWPWYQYLKVQVETCLAESALANEALKMGLYLRDGGLGDYLGSREWVTLGRIREACR